MRRTPTKPLAPPPRIPANGNLTYKSDVGILSYTAPKHPHAATGIPGETFSYNAVGNQITRPGGVGTTGPSETGLAQPALRQPDAWDAVWDGVGDAARGTLDDLTTPPWETAFKMLDAYKKGDALDAFNQVNPLIAVADISLAHDDGDDYAVARQSVALGVTVIGSVSVHEPDEDARPAMTQPLPLARPFPS